MRVLLILIFITYILFPVSANEIPKKDKKKKPAVAVIHSNLEFLNKYFIKNETWHTLNTGMGKSVIDLVHFIESQPLDSAIKVIKEYEQKTGANYITRLPENVDDTLNIEGYYTAVQLQIKLDEIRDRVTSEYKNKEVTVPYAVLSGIESKAGIVLAENGMVLFTDSVYTMPDSLKFLDAIPDSMVQTAQDFQRILKLDSIRDDFVENKRLAYNDSIVENYRDSVILAYKKEIVQNAIKLQQKQIEDSVKINNYELVKTYNEQVIREINDSISVVLSSLVDYANSIDSTQINLLNINNQSSELTLNNDGGYYTRVWLKNEQNDSMSVLIQSVNNKSLRMLIDDDVRFSRNGQQDKKEFDFSMFGPRVNLDKIGKRYKLETPWIIGGDGNLGFTQTYVENWKKGGKSSLSMLMVLKGFANYSYDKIKWENSAEIRNGWIKPGGEKVQKNDDKFEITSRIGVSAFKKWYYSAEIDYETQFFRGYKYPKEADAKPISAFLSPSKTLFKLGLDYKPNKNFSLFLSPFTSKTVFVRDTLNVDQTNFGVESGRRSFWEPGLNADLKYKKEIMTGYTYETKFKMFINYTEPFKKFDINWENQITMQLTDHINMRLMLYLLYDDNVLFTVKDSEGNAKLDENNKEIKKPKLQFKELITLGFTYKINKKVYRTRKLD